MVLGLDQIEFRFVRAVVAADVGISDIDLRFDLFVQQLFFRQRPPQIALQIVQRNIALLQLLVPLFLGVGRFDFGEFPPQFSPFGDGAPHPERGPCVR